MPLRAKFICTSIKKMYSGNDLIYSYEFMPVTTGSEENKTFWKYTPSGKIELGTVHVDAFEIRKEYYIDFIATDSEHD